MVRTRSGKVAKSPLCGIWNKRTRSGNVTKSHLCGVRNKLSTCGNAKVAKSRLCGVRIKQSSSGVEAKLMDEDTQVPEANNNTEGMMDSQAEENIGAHTKDNVIPGAKESVDFLDYSGASTNRGISTSTTETTASTSPGISTNSVETTASTIQGISTNSTESTASTIQGISTNSTETTASTSQGISSNSVETTASTIQGISTNSTESTASTNQGISTNSTETTATTIHGISTASMIPGISTNTSEATDSTIQGISTASTIPGISANSTETTASTIQGISSNSQETGASMIQGISSNSTAITTICGDVDSTATVPSAHHICTLDITVSTEDDDSIIQDQGTVDRISNLSKDRNCSVSDVQKADHEREDRSVILSQIEGTPRTALEDTNGPEHDCCSVSNPHNAVFLKNQSKISSLATTINEVHENSQDENTETAKVFKPPRTHRKKSPFICATCFKSYFRKDLYLVHITDHTRERLRHVPPKRRHKLKTASSEGWALERSQSFVKKTAENLVNLRDNMNLDNANRNSPAILAGSIEKQNESEESLIQIDNMEDNDQEEFETTITISDDESEEADPIHGEAPYESNIPELVQYFTTTSPSTTHSESQKNVKLPENSSPVNVEISQDPQKSTNASNSIHFHETPKVNQVETSMIDLSEDNDTMNATINSSNDEAPVNENVQTCNRKIARFFMYQPLRQNQIPDGGFKNKMENNLEPISHEWPKVNPAKDSRRIYGEVLERIKLLGADISVTRETIPVKPAKDSRRSYGDVLDRIKRLGPEVSVTRRTIPVSTSRAQEKEVTNMKVKETVSRVKRLKVCLPQTGAIPPGEK